MTDKSVRGAVDKATDNPAFRFAARAGYAVSGVLHLVVAYIILRIAIGSGGTADQSGALGTMAGQPGGALMLWIAAVGFLALALWQVAEAVVGQRPGERSRPKPGSPVVKRLKAAGVAVVYFALAYSAARFAMGSGKSSSQQNAGLSAELMRSGWGKTVLVLVGLAVIAVGAYHIYKGASKRFLEDLSASVNGAVSTLGVVGYVAKGLVLAGAGVLIMVASLRSDPSKSTGLDAAAKTLGAAPFGKVLLIIAAVGFAAFAAYSFVRSRYGRM
jgi:hypothetical protein